MSARPMLEHARSVEWMPWNEYTPTWTGATTNPVINNGTLYGRFRRAGTTGECRGLIQVGTTTTFGSGEWRVSLPTGWTISSGIPTNGYQVGFALCVPTAGSAMNLLCWAQPGQTVLRLVTNAATAASVTSTSPAAWTASASNWLSWNITLELAT